MIRFLSILGAIVSAWISGAASGRDRTNGSLVFLVIACLCGAIAWWW